MVSDLVVSFLKTSLPENRVSAIHMWETGLRHLGIAGRDPGSVTSNGFLAVVAIVIAGSGAVFGVLASTSRQPVLLTLMALLAMLGVFFLFAIAAGHLRLTERLVDSDLPDVVSAHLRDGVLVTGRDAEMLYCNPAWEAVVGRGGSGTLRSFDQIVVGQTLASEAVFRLTQATGERRTHTEEFELPPAVGQTSRWYRLSVAPLPSLGSSNDSGHLALWTISDISAERARQSGHIASLESTIKDYDGLPVGFLAVAADGCVRQVNATLASWLGLPGDAGRALKLGDLMSEDAVHLLKVLARQGAGEGAKADMEFVRDDGKRLPVTVVARSGGASADDGFAVAVLARDAERAAPPQGRAAEPRFARLFQSAPFGIATITAEGRIISANAAFGRMLLEPASVEGRHVTELVCRSLQGELRASAERTITQALAGQAAVQPIEVPVGPQADFTRRFYMSALTQAPGSREAAVLFLIDVTEQKALELKFAQSQKMEAVGKLAGGIAHDFNNVLTAIIGFSDLLLQTHRPTDAAYKDIINIRSSANRAAGMVRQLLAFSRRQTMQAEVLQLGEVITDLSPLLNRAIGEKIEIKILPGRDLWFVKADKTQFEQVMINLAVNAGDAMAGGGKLSIRTRNVNERESTKVAGAVTPGEYVLVEVEDTGVGMSTEIMSKIFEPFFTTKGVGKGTGLGLATVYGIIKQMGGFIYPDSTPGAGTIFRVYLPRHQRDAEMEYAAQKEKKKERLVDLTGTGCVLLVEDEDIVRNFAVRALKRQGYEVLEASTGIEALELMKQHASRVDIVVSDVVMPEMDGPTLLKELRKTNKDLKIIFVSGYPDDAFKKSLDENEQFAFLPKPFSLPQLAQKVKEELAQKVKEEPVPKE